MVLTVALPVMAQASTGRGGVIPAGVNPGGLAHGLPPGPNRPGPEIENPTATSTNWSGYAAIGGTYRQVSSTWRQPNVRCGSQNTYSAFWVGLDGDGTPSVEQTGTMANCANGAPRYAGWFEMYPANPVPFGGTVRPDDVMTATVVASSPTEFRLTLADRTAGWSRTTQQRSSTARLGSAEVIAEAPYQDGVLPLADFGSVRFGGATVNGHPIAETNPTRIDMVSARGQRAATTSPLGGDGRSFSIRWLSTG